MREAQPHGTLPLYLSNKAANTEAEARQADRLVEGPEDAFAKTILEWFQTPVTRRDVEEDLGGGFADLDGPDAEDTTPGLRTVCTGIQAWKDALGRPEYLYDHRAQLMVGKALSQIEELSKPKQRRVGGVRVRYRHRVGHGNDGPWTELPEGHETFAQQEGKALKG
jgi:hypothetical protein